MILVDSKAEASAKSSSPLSLSTPDEKPTLSFSDLLKGATLKKDEKNLQDGPIVLALKEEPKEINSDIKEAKKEAKPDTKETLSSLLKNETNSKPQQTEILELSPKITQNLSIKEIKTLIADAKAYLKDKILQSEGYKKAELQDIPKTLKGLVQLAQKFGIDVTKFTIEDVQVKAKTASSTLDIDNKVNSKSEIPTQLKQTVQMNSELISKQIIKEKTVNKDVATELKEKIQFTNNLEEKKIAPQVQVEQLKKTPIFQAKAIVVEHTTQQFVATKQLKVSQKPQVNQADETLKLLLKGEKAMKANPTLTADFSVATARVIAPSASSEASKALETLLHGDKSETSSKTDGLNVHKADSFEVKLNEAKQMIKYLSSDVKTAIEDYKSPFTRVKLQLNPQKLGEVDLTIVQRGKNLHVNISSNQTAINTLAMNANELRVQLNNTGINNASLNFNNSSQNEQQNSQQQQRNQERDAHEEYNYFDNEEQNEEIINSLEIVVPYYA